MIQGLTRRLAGLVTTHNRLVILVVLAMTAGVAMGIVHDADTPEQEVDEDAIGTTDVFQAAEYISERYGTEDDGPDATANVYVRDPDGSVLTRGALLDVLSYQIEVSEDPDVAAHLADEGILGPPNVVARQLAGDPDADLAAQREAVEAASEEEVRAVVESTFTGGEETRFYLPTSYEAGTADAEGMRMTVFLDVPDGESGVPEEVQATLYETAGAYEEPAIFTSGQFALEEMSAQYLQDIMWLVIPSVLLILVIILGFAYRDVTDVLVGFAGTLLALVWSMGLMGWMGLLSQEIAIIVPVLIAALSIDFGFHVFMRYRERRGPEDGIRAALSRSMAAVAVAFVLVTVTAAIGFLSNLTSPVSVIRQLGVAITVGVVATLFIFVTIVPALKVSADGLWERFGFDRRKPALGKGRYLGRVLGLGADAAGRAAVPVIVVAVIVGLAGGMAFGDLDREPFQQADFTDVPEWQTKLPGPMAFEFHETEAAQRFTFAQEEFQSDQEAFDPESGGTGFTQMLVRSDDGVDDPAAMDAVAAGHDAAADADDDVVLVQGDAVHVVSPLTVMESVAARDDDFAEAFTAADTDGDGVPDRNVEALYDELFATAPDEAAQVIERTDDGRYPSLLVLVPAQAGFGSERANVMHGIADEMATASNLDVTAVGIATINSAETNEITEGIVLTLLLALAGVAGVLTVAFRLVRGSATLGAITALPIALALGMVFGSMYLLEEPLTLLTALLVGITIGLGIDYNIHLSDRYAEERARGQPHQAALREAVTGTGGALLGSAVTSGGAFGVMMLIPDPQLSSFGLIVVLALGTSFLLSVFVLPSLITLHDRWRGEVGTTATERGVPQD